MGVKVQARLPFRPIIDGALSRPKLQAQPATLGFITAESIHEEKEREGKMGRVRRITLLGAPLPKFIIIFARGTLSFGARR